MDKRPHSSPRVVDPTVDQYLRLLALDTARDDATRLAIEGILAQADVCKRLGEGDQSPETIAKQKEATMLLLGATLCEPVTTVGLFLAWAADQ